MSGGDQWRIQDPGSGGADFLTYLLIIIIYIYIYI